MRTNCPKSYAWSVTIWIAKKRTRLQFPCLAIRSLSLMKLEMVIKYTRVSPRKIYMITPSTCTCAGRNALRESLNQHAKNLYPKKPEARLFLSKGTGSFTHNHVCSHQRFIFGAETGDGDCDA